MDATTTEPAVVARDRSGTWFADDRGVDRRLRVSWHPERRLFVLSVWHRDTCTATFRLPLAEVPRLLHALVDAVGQAVAPGGTRAGGASRHRWQRGD